LASLSSGAPLDGSLAEESDEVDSPSVDANATAGRLTIAEPTPNATASAPTRPMYFA
jgi:hypothetical protein